MSQQLHEVIPVGLVPEQVRARIRSISAAYTKSSDFVRLNRPRSERNLVLYNLLTSVISYLDVCVKNMEGPIAVLALCTRTVFELNLRTRHILKAETNLRAWIAEAGVDQVGVLKCILELAAADDPRAAILRQEILRIESLTSKHAFIAKKPTTIKTLATEVGLGGEYSSLFKLWSKLVHPSSYLVNTVGVLDDRQTRLVLLAHLQLYALDLLRQVADELEIPDTTIAPERNGEP